MLGSKLMGYNPVFVPRHMERSDPMASMRNVDIDEYANSVVHPVTNKTLTKYPNIGRKSSVSAKDTCPSKGGVIESVQLWANWCDCPRWRVRMCSDSCDSRFLIFNTGACALFSVSNMHGNGS